MRAMIEVIEKVLQGFEDNTMHHVNTSDDPYTNADFQDSCLRFNNALLAWRVLAKKAKATGTTEDTKKEFRLSTVKLYHNILTRQSMGNLVTDKNQQFQETLTLMEQRIESLKGQLEQCKDENKQLVKKISKSENNEGVTKQLEQKVRDNPAIS